MARTTFSGPVVSNNGFVFPATTAAALGSAANAINTTDKFTGETAVDLSTGIIYTATGALPTSPWRGSNSSTITPS